MECLFVREYVVTQTVNILITHFKPSGDHERNEKPVNANNDLASGKNKVVNELMLSMCKYWHNFKEDGPKVNITCKHKVL